MSMKHTKQARSDLQHDCKSAGTRQHLGAALSDCEARTMVLAGYPERLSEAEDASRRARRNSLDTNIDSLAVECFCGGERDEIVAEIPPSSHTLREQHSTSWLIEESGSLERPPTEQGSLERLHTALTEKFYASDADGRSSSGNPQAHRALDISIVHETLFVGVAVMAQFMVLAGLGQAIAPGYIIADELGVQDPGKQAWFTAAYSLTVGTFILIAGRVGDILGHKRLLVFAYFWLGVWSGFGGFSSYLGRQIFFDCCRAMQGIGAAILAPNALALLGRAYPPSMKKNLIFSLFGAMAPWGFVTGALFGSIFGELVWWPWAFWSYGITAWALAVLALLVVPKSLAYDAQFAERTSKPTMDWTGSFLGVAGLVLINVALNNGPLFGWGTSSVYFTLVVGVMLLVGFFWVEAHIASPFLPVKAMSGTVLYTMALLAVGWGSFGA